MGKMDNLEADTFAIFREGGLVFFVLALGPEMSGPISQAEFMAKLSAERAGCRSVLEKIG